MLTVEEFKRTLEYWRKRDFKGADVSDIKSSRLFILLNQWSLNSQIGKRFYYPFDLVANHFPNLIRNLFSLNSHRQYPQAYANIIRGLIDYCRITQDDEYGELAISMAGELIELRNKDFKNLCWGQPYRWPSNQIMEPNVPRTTVTSQVAAAFLDLYEYYRESKYLEYAQSICRFFIHDLNYTRDMDGHFCFSYTSEDHYHVHNPSILAASILYRTHFHDGNEEWIRFGYDAAKFTAKHQNEDGSWYYRSKPDKVRKVIDNYHTGFVLEGFRDIKTYSRSGFEFQSQIDAGLAYYLENFFGPNSEPKYRPEKIYPIDIQACAQTIITLSMYHDHELVTESLLSKVVDYTLQNFYDKEGRFYYRIYANNKIDHSSFIRWGDSWMIRAMGVFENRHRNNE